MLLKAGNGTYDSDYAYIDLFIDFLERIIEIIMKLFSGLGGSAEETPEENA